MKRRYMSIGFAIVAGTALISTAAAAPGASTLNRGHSAASKRPALVVKKKRKRGKRGPIGQPGQQGATGLQGSTGSAQGMPGPAGDGTALWVHQVTPTPADCATPECSFIAMSGTIATGGQYLLTAKLRLNNVNTTFSSYTFTCNLERTPPVTTVDTTTTGNVPWMSGTPVSLQGAATFAAGDGVQVSCSNPGGNPGDVVATQGSIIATPFAYAEN